MKHIAVFTDAARHPIISMGGAGWLLALWALSAGFGMSQEKSADVDKPVVTETPAQKSRANRDACCDKDPEQWTAAVEEFQAVSDRTTHIQSEEMPAYWRLLSWVSEQSPELLRQRAKTAPVRNSFLHDPDALRGQLYQLNLDVCRVLPYDVPDNRLGVRRLYEVWGFAGNSGAWMYVVITPELPPGFPMGALVSESATVCGYFFKLQGYLETGAQPRSQPLHAPLFIGKIEWKPDAPQQSGTNRGTWIAAFAALFVAWTIYRLVTVWGRRSNRSVLQTNTESDLPPLNADQWLQKMRQSSVGDDRPTGPGES